VLDNSALVKLRPNSGKADDALSGNAFSIDPAPRKDEVAEETVPEATIIAEETTVTAHPREFEELSTTMYDDIGVEGVHKQASEVRRQKATQTDEALFERIARDRSQEAYSEFYDRFSPRIYALLLHMLRAEEDAQDLLQEVFVLVWQKAPQFLESRGNVAPWVISIARNRAVDEIRSKRHREKSQETELVMSEDRPEIDQIMIDSQTPDLGLQAADAKREVTRALRELSKDQRSIIDMAYFGGMTHVEIAQRLEMPVGTVKTKMRQAIIKMGRRLRPRF
jgi:RNA polymerase sigma-70 factor (ECF subfamily)